MVERLNRERAVFEDFKGLQEHLRTLGAFEYSRGKLSRDLLLLLNCFVAAVFLQKILPIAAFVLATIGGISLVWWIHDAGHDAYFQSRRVSKLAIETLGILFLGMPQIEYHFEIHRQHHGSTNIIGKDRALETGPILWHPLMVEKGRKPLPVQWMIWIFLVLPLTWPLITVRCVQMMVKKRAYLRLSCLGARWMIVALLLRFDWLLILGPILITGFVLGFSASLNHFHMPMDTRPLALFPCNVFATTQNLSQKNRLMTWLTGGLNFHIEHHLFPRMPSANLKFVAPYVEAFALKHGLPYSTCSVTEATGKLIETLKYPERSHGFQAGGAKS